MMKQLPKDERPREKLINLGVASLSNTELLAILIGSGTKDVSAMSLASHILSLEKEGLAYLCVCHPEELKVVKGIGIAKACQIISAVEMGRRIAARPMEKKVNVQRPSAVAALVMEEMRYLKKEVFRVMLVNIKAEMMMIEDVSVGNLGATTVHPREVFERPLKKGAHGIILIHNHPSGDPTPSNADLEVTRRLVDAGKILGVEVMDHLIIGDGVFTSFVEQSII